MNDDQGNAIYMVCTSGLFIMGGLNSGNKLINPRVFTLLENGQRMQLSPLPATPPFITIGPDGFKYPVPDTDKNLLALYHRVTHPNLSAAEQKPDEKKVIASDEGKVIKLQ